MRSGYEDPALPPGSDAVIPSGADLDDWAARRVAHLTRPRVHGPDLFMRHTRHSGQLVIRTRPRRRPAILQRPGDPVYVMAAQRVILAWRPDDPNLPTALLRASRCTVDPWTLLDDQPGDVKVHLHTSAAGRTFALVIPMLRRPTTTRHRRSHQACIRSEDLGPMSWRILASRPPE